MEAKISVRDGTFEKNGTKHVFEYSHHTVTNNYKQHVLVQIIIFVLI